MTGAGLVQWMEDGGWSAAGLSRALEGEVSTRTIWRWRRGETPVPTAWAALLLRLRTPAQERSLKRGPRAQAVRSA